MKISKGLLQAYQIQDLTYDTLIAFKEGMKKEGKLSPSRADAKAVKDLVAAWREAQERVSFHRRVPSPGVMRPEDRPKRKYGQPSTLPKNYASISPMPAPANATAVEASVDPQSSAAIP